MDSKRIGNFKQFQKKQGKKRINESKVSVECEFWDVCIVEVLQLLETQAQGMVWDNIIKYCRDKWAILGRTTPLPDYDDNILTQHIKDLIFQLHGDSLYTDWHCDLGWENQQIHSKGLVIEELAAVILGKVREKTKPEDESDTGGTTGTLSDMEPITMVPMTPCPAIDDNGTVEYEEDLPCEYEKNEVIGFGKYTKLIEEAKSEFKLANKQKVIDYTLNRIEQEASSLKLDDIALVVVRKYGPAPDNEGYDLMSKYIRSIVIKYLYEKGVVKTYLKNEGIFISKSIMKSIFDMFAEMVVEEILHNLAEASREEEEDEEVE